MRTVNSEAYWLTADSSNSPGSELPENQAMQWNFPEGSLGPDAGRELGVAPGISYDEIYFSYDVMFKPGFEFVLGGKIPGAPKSSRVPWDVRRRLPLKPSIPSFTVHLHPLWPGDRLEC